MGDRAIVVLEGDFQRRAFFLHLAGGPESVYALESALVDVSFDLQQAGDFVLEALRRNMTEAHRQLGSKLVEEIVVELGDGGIDRAVQFWQPDDNGVYVLCFQAGSWRITRRKLWLAGKLIWTHCGLDRRQAQRHPHYRQFVETYIAKEIT